MIYLSATGLKDLLKCEKNFYYRINRSEESIITIDMVYGKILHKVIQNFTSADTAQDWISRELQETRSLNTPAYQKKAKTIVDNYYNVIVPKLSTENVKIEFDFKIKVNDNLAIVGRMDRVDNLGIYDWKSSTRPPDAYTLSDLQFYVYWWAYRELFKKDPQNIYYGHIFSGTLYNIDMGKARLHNLEVLLDKAEKLVYNGLAARNMGRHCANCLFRGICYEELGKEN